MLNEVILLLGFVSFYRTIRAKSKSRHNNYKLILSLLNLCIQLYSKFLLVVDGPNFSVLDFMQYRGENSPGLAEFIGAHEV